MLVGSLVSGHLLLRDRGRYVIIFMNMFVIAIVIVMSLRDFGPYGIIFMIIYETQSILDEP